MATVKENNKRVIKNTIALYIRMLFVMLVSLYTSRVVLEVLGETDYGIYNLVGGIVVMFSFLSTIFSSASQRYFTFELGKNNFDKLCTVFNITMLLYFAVVFVLLLVSESFGLWFLNHKLNIPETRMYAARWVFQASVISFCITVLATPYQSVIIAHEKMGMYAIVGIVEASLNLLFVLALKYCVHDGDNLIIYSYLILVKVLICQSIYFIYSRRSFIETKIKWLWDNSLAKEMISYSWWNIFGGIASVCRDQGTNLLIGMFFAPAINAARGLAIGISGALNVFSTNFFTAVRPQITKYYAQDDIDATLSLVFKSSKFSYYLIAFISIPMIVFIKPILGVWLVDVPQYTALFAQLVIIVALIDSLNLPLMTLMQATGHVKLYQLMTGGLIFCNLPLSYLSFKLGCSAEYAMYVSIFISIACTFSRLFVCRRYVTFPIRKYCFEIITRIVFVSAVCFCISELIYRGLNVENAGFIVLCITMGLAIVATLVCMFIFGLSKSEKVYVKEMAISKLKHNK